MTWQVARGAAEGSMEEGKVFVFVAYMSGCSLLLVACFCFCSFSATSLATSPLPPFLGGVHICVSERETRGTRPSVSGEERGAHNEGGSDVAG